jgi:MFS family permease
LVTFLHDDLTYGLVAAGLLLSITQAGGIVGRIVWGHLADQFFGPQKMLAVLATSMALCAAATPLVLHMLPVYGVWTLLLLFGASAIGWNGVYLAEVARQAPEGKASVATGGTLTFTFLGGGHWPTPLWRIVNAVWNLWRWVLGAGCYVKSLQPSFVALKA